MEKYFNILLMEKKNIVNVNADIAREINEDKKTQLKLTLNKALNRNSELSFNVDPKILGGIRLRVGNELIDASLANHLNKLRHKMLDAK
jgi:F-type H+-transporting ATPase subunit delta